MQYAVGFECGVVEGCRVGCSSWGDRLGRWCQNWTYRFTEGCFGEPGLCRKDCRVRSGPVSAGRDPASARAAPVQGPLHAGLAGTGTDGRYRILQLGCKTRFDIDTWTLIQIAAPLVRTIQQLARGKAKSPVRTP